MNKIVLIFVFIATTFIILQCCDCAKIDKKLDFSESEEEDDDDEDESGSEGSDSESSSSDKSTTSIKGVKVSIDTKAKKKGSPEAKSESESGETKTVGIRTDITVEISSETNGTSKNGKNGKKADKDKGDKDAPKNDNASVPVFKGRDSSKPNQQSSVNNYPIFHGIWTTERTFYRRLYDDNRSTGPLYNKGFSNWKPCYCSVYQSVRPTYETAPPFQREHFHVDDKLDYPFRRINK